VRPSEIAEIVDAGTPVVTTDLWVYARCEYCKKLVAVRLEDVEETVYADGIAGDATCPECGKETEVYFVASSLKRRYLFRKAKRAERR